MNEVALAKEISEIKNEQIIELYENDEVIDLMNGKYTLKLTNNGDKFVCNRYGQPWRRLDGDKMALALFYEVLNLKDIINDLTLQNIKLTEQLQQAINIQVK